MATHNLIPRVSLHNKILACIEAGICRTNEIAAQLGISPSTAHTQLHYLKSQYRIHPTKELTQGGRRNVWVAGRDPSLPDDELDTDPLVRQVSTEYPVVARRDYLVAALFGAPKANSELYLGAA